MSSNAPSAARDPPMPAPPPARPKTRSCPAVVPTSVACLGSYWTANGSGGVGTRGATSTRCVHPEEDDKENQLSGVSLERRSSRFTRIISGRRLWRRCGRRSPRTADVRKHGPTDPSSRELSAW